MKVENFSLSQTIESGQLFRYEKVTEGYLVSHGNKAFLIEQIGSENGTSKLVVHKKTKNVTEEWLIHFFALDEKAPSAVDEYSEQAIAFSKGLRVCRQDSWECTIAFICSQNNNIPRIRQLMKGLAKAFGKKIMLGSYEVYLMPEPGKIKAGLKLKNIKTGYREKYLLSASKNLTISKLEKVRKMPYEKAKEFLLEQQGIGPKVADCILLFAYQHQGAFPIDTWIETIMKEQYGGGTHKTMREVAQKQFGENAGVVQQHLFHYRRLNKQNK